MGREEHPGPRALRFVRVRPCLLAALAWAACHWRTAADVVATCRDQEGESCWGLEAEAAEDDAAEEDFEEPLTEAAEDEAVEEEAEENLMEVTLLQTSLRLGPRGTTLPSREVEDSHRPESMVASSPSMPSSPTWALRKTARAAAEVAAAGAVAPASAPPAAASATRVALAEWGRELEAVPAGAMPEAAALEDLHLGTSLMQTDLEVTPVDASSIFLESNASGREPQEAWQQPAHARPKSSLALALQDLLHRHGLVRARLLSDRSWERNLMVGYVSFYLCSVAIMTWYVRRAPKSEDGSTASKRAVHRQIEVSDAEQRAWDQGFLRWFSVSWASSWVAYWSSIPPRLGAVQVKAKYLPQLGNADHQASSCAKVFSKLWLEDMRTSGEDPSVFRVMLRVWTTRSMVSLLALVTSHVVIAQVGSVLLLQEALAYFHYLRGRADVQLQESMDMTGPLVVWIAAFSALPLSSAVLSSATTSLSCRLDQRLCGGLSVVLFEKAQRLPKHRLRSAGTGSPKAGGDGAEGEGGGEEPIDLTALVGYDVYGSLLGCYHQLCTCIGSGAAIVALVALLWCQLGAAALCAAACAVPVVLLLLGMSAGLGRAMYKVQGLVDRRVTALREVLFGIRTVKCCAWEDAVEEKLSVLRRDEVAGLQRYYFFLGGFMGIFLSFPRVLILAGLWGYSAIYGRHHATTIFTCVQILASLKSSCEAFTRSLGRAITVNPSLRRVEAFLKLPEVPAVASGSPGSWVDLWPSPRGFGPRGPMLEADAPSEPRELALRLHGSFRWTEDSPPILRDLQLDAPQGALVGIVGGVGSGKSALLQAVLGELYPVLAQDGPGPPAMLSRPDAIAFCPQVPYIGDGTIRENILFGQPEDEARYAEALRSVALEPDLRLLPGGDRMAVGARGVALSAGQRARVALARAAYRRDARLAVLDEPFAALDQPTASAIVDRLLMGPLLRDRTRLVALQADPDLLARFDHVVVMANGRIREQGPPEAVFQSLAFRKLAGSGVAVASTGGTEDPTTDAAAGSALEDGPALSRTSGGQPRHTIAQAAPAEAPGRGLLAGGAREDVQEAAGPTWDMARQYCSLGRWRNIVNASILFCVQIILHVLCDLVLAHWSNTLCRSAPVNDKPFLHGYLLWLGLGIASWLVCWKFGEWFTLRISSQIHDLVLCRVLRAPVDRFFDRHPVGRIMNRLSADLAVVDLFLFMKSTGTMAVVFQTLIPLIYVHIVMPWFILLLALPLYYYIWAVASQYWNATIPLRYCLSGSRAALNGLLADVSTNGAIVRAYRDQERVTAEMCEAVDGQLRACLLGERTIRRWLVNRILFLWSFFASSAYAVSLLSPSFMGVGTLGLCLTSLLLLQSLIEPNLDQVTGAQSEFVALARIHEYLAIPQEKPRATTGDSKYRDFSARVSRKELRALGELSYATYAYEGSGSAVQVLRAGRPILRSTADSTALVAVRQEDVPAPKQAAAPQAAPAGGSPHLLDLCPSCPELSLAESWHRLVAVGGAVRDAEAMARELCGCCYHAATGSGEEQAEEDGEQDILVLDIQSGWLSDGARVVVESLKAGYGDAPRDALKGISLSFAPRERVGLVGPSGSGKSTLLLVLLRVLEPRAGRVLLNDVDARHVGLAVLRQALGLVPQDPVLFSGTLRYNLDPYECHSDERIWQALASTRLTSLAEASSEGLDQHVSQEAGEPNFGQRQLLSLARMVLRQPALLLLDEAASPTDPHTEACLKQAVRTSFPVSTVLAATRRLETVSDFDRVLVFERGSVVDEGPPAEVAQRSGSGGRL